MGTVTLRVFFQTFSFWEEGFLFSLCRTSESGLFAALTVPGAGSQQRRFFCFFEVVVYLEKIQLQQKTGDSKLEVSHHYVNTYTRKYVYCIYIHIDMHIWAKYTDQTAGGSPQMVVIVRDPNPLTQF